MRIGLEQIRRMRQGQRLDAAMASLQRQEFKRGGSTPILQGFADRLAELVFEAVSHPCLMN